MMEFEMFKIASSLVMEMTLQFFFNNNYFLL